jgi:hypothetical protein
MMRATTKRRALGQVLGLPPLLPPAVLAGAMLLGGAACESSASPPPAAPVPASTPAPAAPAVAPVAAAEPSVATAPGTASPAGAAAPGGTQAFGGAFEPGPEVPLATLLANPAAYGDKAVITQGKVQRACSRKGCWMEIGDDTTGENASACRVTFKDYGFFVPTDSAGARARIQGRLDTHVISAARVAHLEEEGARFENKQADGSATEVQLIATAVQLAR